MKKQIRAIAAVAAATMLLTGCAAHKQNNASEQTPTTQTQSNTASSVSTETTPARENWSLLDHLPKWSDGTVTPAVTANPNSGIQILSKQIGKIYLMASTDSMPSLFLLALNS